MFINASGTLGVILGNATQVSIGSMVVALLILLVVLLGFCLMFGIPFEYSAIIVLPLVLSYMAYYREFFVTGGVIFIYLAIILTKNWIFR